MEQAAPEKFDDRKWNTVPLVQESYEMKDLEMQESERY
jgi:hypothetical protein